MNYLESVRSGQDQFQQLIRALQQVKALSDEQLQNMVSPKKPRDFVVRLLEADVDDKKLAQVLAQLFDCHLFQGEMALQQSIIRSRGDRCPWLLAHDILYVTNPYDRDQIEPLMRRKNNPEDPLFFSGLGIIAMSAFEGGLLLHVEPPHQEPLDDGSGTWAQNLMDRVFEEAIARQATDIHIAPDVHGVSVRFRVDGRCVNGVYPELDQSSQLKLLANYLMDRCGKQNNHLQPVSGYMTFQAGHKQVSIRLEMTPVKVDIARYPKITLRLLNLKRSLTRIEHFHLPEQQRQCFNSFVIKPQGLLVVTGPTGSGKSTTLKALLRDIRDRFPGKTIYSIEDPVEEQIDGVVALEVDQHMDFAEALRSLLRHDPDVIMVGEIRDSATAALATRAALTGHLVLTTLHCSDAHGAITRLRDFGVQNALIAENLIAVTAQRLVPRICPHCSEWAPVHVMGQEILARQKTERSNQCPHCEGGVRGRVLVQEILENTPLLQSHILANKNAPEIRGQDQLGNFEDLWSHGMTRLIQGEACLESLTVTLGRCPSSQRNRAGMNLC